LVVQHDRFNGTSMATVAVCAITSNLGLADVPGNVRLRKGEAGLPKASVVNITQIHAIDRAFLDDRSGALSARRMDAVWRGLCLLLEVAR